MFENEYWKQMCSYFDQLPRSQDAFFHELWQKGRLYFEGTESRADWIDKSSAQLVCAALSKRKPLLIVLPDEAPHRIPMLFATALLMHAYDVYRPGSSSKQTVIYFSTSTGIRSYLSQTYCRNYRLSEIFNQTNLKKNLDADLPTLEFNSCIPHVIFCYAPIALDKIVNHYRPDWCFIDCSIGEQLEWIRSLLTVLKQVNIPALACIQNPISDIIYQFQKSGWPIFRWPYPTFGGLSQLDIDTITTIQPVILGGEAVARLSEQYKQIYELLFTTSSNIKLKLAQDALRVIWRYARSLEMLNTPYNFYEAENRQFWGLHSLSHYQQTAHCFVETLQSSQPSLSKVLGTTCEHLDKIHQQLQPAEPPLWEALCNLCVDNISDDTVRMLVFPTEARKDLFAFALLAYHDISTDELSDISVWLTSLKQFNRLQRARERQRRSGKSDNGEIPKALTDKLWCPLLVGLPYRSAIAKYAPLLRCGKLDILIYPHQVGTLQRYFDEWNQILNVKHPDNLITLANLAHIQFSPSPSSSDEYYQRLNVTNSQRWTVEPSSDAIRKKMNELFHTSLRVDEIAWLIQEDDNELVEDTVFLDEQDRQVTNEGENKEPILVNQAMQVIFSEGYRVMMHSNATMQVVLQTSQGRKLDERSIRSIRPGDRIMFIHGQHRQNLYELILSRIHAHPSFILHLNLIQRWQDELIQCYRYKKSQLTVDNILYQMQQSGSQLQTPQAIRLWLCRRVMCPNDMEDLQRIAYVLDMPFVKQYHKQIARAASRLRGIHIWLSRKLNLWLQMDAIEANSDMLNEIIDPELELTFQDFQNALLQLTVEKVEQVNGLFLCSELGKLYQGVNTV